VSDGLFNALTRSLHILGLRMQLLCGGSATSRHNAKGFMYLRSIMIVSVNVQDFLALHTEDARERSALWSR